MGSQKRRWVAAIGGLAVVLAACGTSTGVGSSDQQPGFGETTSSAPTSATAPSAPSESDTTTTSPTMLEFSATVQAEFALSLVIDGDGSFVLGTVASLDGELMTVTVDRVVVDNGGIEDEYEVAVPLGDVSVGDTAAISLGVNPPTGEWVVVALGVWDAETDEPRPRTNPEDTLAILGETEILSYFWDPPSVSRSCGIPVDDRAYDDALQVLTAHVEGTTPRQTYNDLRSAFPAHSQVAQLANAADREGAATARDPVSGRATPVDENAVFYQLFNGVSEADIAYQSTVPVVFDVSSLDETIYVALLDLDAGLMLGHTVLGPNDGADGLVVAFAGQPQEGNAVTVVSYDTRTVSGCGNPYLLFNRLIEPGLSTTLATVSYDNFAGTARLQIDLASGDTQAVGREAFAGASSES